MNNSEAFEKEVVAKRKWAASTRAHVSGCKKAPDECKQCVRIIQTFADMPAMLLSRVLGE